MFRSFVLRSLLVFVFSTAPFASYAFTPSTIGCGAEAPFSDDNGSGDVSFVAVSYIVIRADSCSLTNGNITPLQVFSNIVIINNTSEAGTGFLQDGVYVAIGAPPELISVYFGGVDLSPYDGDSVANSYKIPNSSKDKAFDDHLTWVYLGAPYYVRVHKAENSTTVLFGPVIAGTPPAPPAPPVPAATTAHYQQAAQAGAQAFGQAATKIAASSTFSRIGCRQDDALGCGAQGSQADFTDSGWTRISSDDVTSMVARNAAQLANDKIEDLDLEALGLADEAIEAVGLDKAALDFYASAAWGSLERKGTAGYDGYGYITTAGADYLITPDLLLGGSVSYEWGRLEYDALANGKVVRDGWRGDVYGGWQLDALVSVEGFASYGRFKNEVTADFEKGRADSERWMTGARIESKFDAIGVELSPYASATYMYERIDGYRTASGVTIAASSAELSQGAFGFMIDSRDPVALGLSPFISLQGEWDWINGGDVTLTNGDVLTADDWGVTWSTGLRGRLTGFAPGTWVGSVLNGSNVSLEYSRSSFGRNNTSQTLEGRLHIPLY